MKIKITRKTRLFITIFTIVFHIYIFSSMIYRYFMDEANEAEKIELLAE